MDARFEYFVKEVLPKQRDPLMSHTLIYVPSYFDFVRIRNYFKKEGIGFVQICEYSKVRAKNVDKKGDKGVGKMSRLF